MSLFTRKVITLAISSILSVSILTGCSSNEEAEEQVEQQPTQQEQQENEETYVDTIFMENSAQYIMNYTLKSFNNYAIETEGSMVKLKIFVDNEYLNNLTQGGANTISNLCASECYKYNKVAKNLNNEANLMISIHNIDTNETLFLVNGENILINELS